MKSDSQKNYWRSLDELENTPEFEQFLHREFPVAASEFPEGVSRRRWMQLMGASLSLGAGVVGCDFPKALRFPEETIAPFAVRPENRVPGKTEKFASTLEIAGSVRPVVVTSYDGRPIKVDGNAEHPEGQGSDQYIQATVLEVYDPDRLRGLTEFKGEEHFDRSWDEFEISWKNVAEELGAGGKLAVLTQGSASPSYQDSLQKLRQRFPQAKVYQYDSITRDSEAAGVQAAFGQSVTPKYHLDKADVIVVIDEDFFGMHPTGQRNSKEFAVRRAPEEGEMNRLYVVESQFTTAGLAADHRIAVPATRIASFVADLEARMAGGEVAEPAEDADRHEKFIIALVDDLKKHQGKAVIAVGPRQPAEVQAAVWKLNQQIGAIGATVELIDAALPTSGEVGTLEELTTQLNGGSIDTVIVISGNPGYDAPANVPFSDAFKKAKRRLFFGYYNNETSVDADWVLPEAHGLESWGDYVAADGSYCLAQPLIETIFHGLSKTEFVALLAGAEEKDGRTIVRRVAKDRVGYATESVWKKMVHDGFAGGVAGKTQSVQLADNIAALTAEKGAWKQRPAKDEVELVLTPGTSTYDGRFANNCWLQELPDTLTKLTWDNALLVNPTTAEALGLKQGILATITSGGASIDAPVYLMPGLALGTISLALGYGRTHAGKVGGEVAIGIDPVGVDVGKLRRSDAMSVVTGVQVKSTGKSYLLATTQDHHSIDKIGLAEIARRIPTLVREGTVEEFKHHPDFAQHVVHHPPLESLWTEASYDGHAWGMSIDLSKCLGCNACVVACQAENNVPIVGKEQVSKGREMHWLRIDRYFAGDPEDPVAVTQPVTCHHCENAPCEQVCPVAATVHSDEGLNDMIYNRCIGTRYCGNNCPYKVRRFNFLDYRASDYRFEESNRQLAELVFNPEVTVRNRGVMEKCTYCVQRIQNTKIDARRDRRAIGANEIKTACQEACSTSAIQFGDLNNPENNASKNHKNPRAYAMLAELNIKPRTKYLARIRNPHPWLADPFVELEHIPGHEGHVETDGEHAHDHEHADHEEHAPAKTESKAAQ
ncbi:TAT-variant-translocated molybdopterin oxidoreductase [Blastopirellula marina]|uniref:Molybdopterin oxidoreductase, iron-sulfur binding subunit n=1 Tax=Blastopirellula marina DSM 3645 TaxID=314230 RepID=A4A0N4_9BACT|nr:TAT-variant-translocated molybdopterin oxidoreductase [Blastopirellula marina]EAQ77700.1 molybdopterin oxidoreductase, iron-sulfur binding subunit [Blastopirellula marina DSM 3645]